MTVHMEADHPVALIFRTRLLPYSETFIRSQAQSLKRYVPYYVGVRHVPGLELPPASMWAANQGGLAGMLQELRFTRIGPSRRCTKQLAALKPALMHAHFGPDGAEAMRLASALNLPLVVTYHGYDATFTDAAMAGSRQGRRYLRARSSMAGAVSQFVAVSHFIRKRMEQQGIPAEKILVHSIGVDTALFARPAVREPASRVLFTGRLTEKKGCAFLIRAMAAVQSVLPDAELIIIGDGDERPQLERQAQASLRNYSFLGRRSPTEVREWMQSSTIFSMPSITAANGDSEGFGIVLAEAQACGTPVVSFASGGIPEAVAHNQTGLLAPERDWQQLAKYLLLLLERRDIWDEFSHAARLHVESHFDLCKQTAMLEDVYAHVCSTHSAQPPGHHGSTSVLQDL